MAKLWRESATLIIVARNANNFFTQGHNFKVLLFTRTEKTSFMGGSACFPGGAIDKVDESKEWLKHFKNFGIKDNWLKDLCNIKGKRPPIFQTKPDSIDKEISLRISAIRETFEEVGVLLCRKKNDILKKSSMSDERFGEYCEDFDKEKWQKLVHNEPSKFLELCQTLEVIPDLWSLYEWSDWLTPASFSKRRFETAFFIVALNSTPVVHPEKHEVQDIYWKTPGEYFDMHRNEQLWLPPPQSYELNRLKNMPSIDVLVDFSKDRNTKGLTLFLPVNYTCKDGMVATLPGDDYYPGNPNDKTEQIMIDETMEEFRKRAKNVHRSEYGTFYDSNLFLNFEPYNDHISPAMKSKL